MKTSFLTRMFAVLLAAVFAAGIAIQPVLAQTEAAAPAAAEAVPEGEEFISWDTLIVGCASGGFSASASAVLPQLTTFPMGGPASAPWSLLGAWFGLGCAVGIWAGILAIGTALLLDS